jgi:hypothetical protein
VIGYLRQTATETVLVALNFSGRPQRLVLGERLARAGWELLLSSQRETAPVIQDGLLQLEPYEAMLLMMK